MSDSEYEYDDDEVEQFEYTDEEEDANDDQVALENSYYNAKGLRDSSIEDATKAFESVIESDPSSSWAFKSLKQLVKLQFRTGNATELLKYYHRLLECRGEEISPNAVEKGIQAMLERVASHQSSKSNFENPNELALQVYDATLRVFHPGGVTPNERLWFKTNLKYGQLLYEMNEVDKLQQVLKDLSVPDSAASSTQSLEIYALQIQLYHRLKDHKKLRETYNKAMNVRGGIPHPRTIALIQELGGKAHMAVREYEAAEKTFFSAFKSYDEAGDPSRLRCLKYLVLASMLHASSINPFDSQEARPYRDDPQIVAMTNLVQAFHNNEIQSFERILKRSRIMEDDFIREHIEDLLTTIRRQVLKSVIAPYSRISLAAAARELNDIPVADVEKLLVGLILDDQLDGKIDRVAGVLYKTPPRVPQPEERLVELLSNWATQTLRMTESTARAVH